MPRTATGPGRMTLLDDPEELRRFFQERARERDKASRNGDSIRKTEGRTKPPKETRDSGEPLRTPASADRGPRPTKKGKTKPYTVRYLTMEEVLARKRETEDRGQRGANTGRAGRPAGHGRTGQPAGVTRDHDPPILCPH